MKIAFSKKHPREAELRGGVTSAPALRAGAHFSKMSALTFYNYFNLPSSALMESFCASKFLKVIKEPSALTT